MMNRIAWIVPTILVLAWTTSTTVALVTPSRSRSFLLSQSLQQNSQRQVQQLRPPQQLRKQLQLWSRDTTSLMFASPNIIPDDHASGATQRIMRSNNIRNALLTIWNRLDTLEAAGINKEFAEYPPLVSRGGGFKRFMIIMAVGMAYKWYRARFINKIPFWEKQPQWNMVVTTKEQEDALRAYTCLNCGATLFIARNREWFFEGGTGLAGLGCYSCGAKGKDNFVMDRERIVDEVGEEDDYFAYERPLDFVSAAERKALLKATKGDEAAANQMLVDQQNVAAPPPPPMFGVMPEDIEAKEGGAEASSDVNEGDNKEPSTSDPVPAPSDDLDLN